MRIPSQDYELIRKILSQMTGIELGPSKQILVESRLNSRLAELKLDSFREYVVYLKSNSDELTEFINSLTTNKTDWFREKNHFEFLVNHVLSKSLIDTENPFLVWSAACSTGEEVYSLAITLKESLSFGQDFRILGTDIDTEVLAYANAGLYRADSVETQVPQALCKKYFYIESDDEDSVCVHSDLRHKIKFRQYNLIQDQFPSRVRFNAIFLRNVLIYFTPETINLAVKRTIQQLKPSGFLFIGHSESLAGMDLDLVQVAETVYQKKAA